MQSKQQLISLVVARTGIPVSRLNTKTIQELEKILDDSLLEQIRAEAQNSPAAIAATIAADERIAEIDADRLRAAQDHQLTLIFRTPINHRVAVDNQANRGIITGWFDETRDDRISPTWFVQVLKENPILAQSLTWQSADVLDPKKRQQEAQEDRKTFSAAARKYGLSDNEASFRLVREVLGEGFSEYAVGQAVNSGAVHISQATEAELDRYRQEAAEQRQQFLRSADVETLRGIVRSEAEQRRIQFHREEDQRQIAARQAKDEAYGFPALPEINAMTGEKLNSAYFIRLSNTDLQRFKNYIRMFGAAQITRALRERT